MKLQIVLFDINPTILSSLFIQKIDHSFFFKSNAEYKTFRRDGGAGQTTLIMKATQYRLNYTTDIDSIHGRVWGLTPRKTFILKLP